jgi:repressor LexA
MLTKKQFELLIFIDKRLKEGSVAPSFDEMKEALSLKSKSGIHRLINALEERGFIRRLAHRARALEVIKLPEGMTAKSPAAQAGPEVGRGHVIQGNFSRGGQAAPKGQPSLTTPANHEPSASTIDIPLHGRIAAGTPIEALQEDNFLSIPMSLLGRGDHYALEVSGDSMIEAGIFDGDTVIIRRADTAENGAIVVALVNGIEATLKYLHRKGSQIALKPANAAYKAQILPASHVRIQGQLVALFRRY